MTLIIFFRRWYVVTFNDYNEVQHIPHTWLLNNEICWFPYIQRDGKNIYFTVSQISNMISKCTTTNKEDGKNYNITLVTGPFRKYYMLINRYKYRYLIVNSLIFRKRKSGKKSC